MNKVHSQDERHENISPAAMLGTLTADLRHTREQVGKSVKVRVLED